MIRAALVAFALLAQSPSLHADEKATPADKEAAAGVAAGFLGMGAVCVGLSIAFGLVLYVIPTFVAWRRGHPNLAAIAAVNLLAGWFLLGWVAALAWSLTAIEPARGRGRYASSSRDDSNPFE